MKFVALFFANLVILWCCIAIEATRENLFNTNLVEDNFKLFIAFINPFNVAVKTEFGDEQNTRE